MLIETRIRENLQRAFSPTYLLVENESRRHQVPEGSETHFRVVLVAEQFVGLSRIERQRRVFRALEAELRDGVHALSQYALTPEEWEKSGQVPKSPDCAQKRGST